MLNQPKILPSSDADWKAYYERRCRIAEKREKAMREAIDAALSFLSEHTNEAGMLGAVMILERAIRHPILRDNALMSHQWTGVQRGGDPTEAGSTEYVRYCRLCGIEDTCEDPLPPCSVKECDKCGGKGHLAKGLQIGCQCPQCGGNGVIKREES